MVCCLPSVALALGASRSAREIVQGRYWELSVFLFQCPARARHGVGVQEIFVDLHFSKLNWKSKDLVLF